jgi:hypothetical protein
VIGNENGVIGNENWVMDNDFGVIGNENWVIGNEVGWFISILGVIHKHNGDDS